MLIFVTQCSSSFNNVLAVLTILAKKQETRGKLEKLSAGPLRDERDTLGTKAIGGF